MAFSASMLLRLKGGELRSLHTKKGDHFTVVLPGGEELGFPDELWMSEQLNFESQLFDAFGVHASRRAYSSLVSKFSLDTVMDQYGSLGGTDIMADLAEPLWDDELPVERTFLEVCSQEGTEAPFFVKDVTDAQGATLLKLFPQGSFQEGRFSTKTRASYKALCERIVALENVAVLEKQKPAQQVGGRSPPSVSLNSSGVREFLEANWHAAKNVLSPEDKDALFFGDMRVRPSRNQLARASYAFGRVPRDKEELYCEKAAKELTALWGIEMSPMDAARQVLRLQGQFDRSLGELRYAGNVSR